MAKTRSKHQKDLYASYKAAKRMETNRKRKLTAALKRNPENQEIVKALASISYRRRTPLVSKWSHQAIAAITLNKAFAKGGSVEIKNCSERQMFKLQTRAHNAGELIWAS